MRGLLSLGLPRLVFTQLGTVSIIYYGLLPDPDSSICPKSSACQEIHLHQGTSYLKSRILEKEKNYKVHSQIQICLNSPGFSFPTKVLLQPNSFSSHKHFFHLMIASSIRDFFLGIRVNYKKHSSLFQPSSQYNCC